MTQDFYLGRWAVDSQAAEALEAALRDAWPGDNRGNAVAKDEGQAP